MSEAATTQPRRRKPADLIVSLDEFASICGVTPETMRKHLMQAPTDAAWMIEKGRRGVGYKIAAAGAVAWWKARSTASPTDDARSAEFAKLRMEMLGDAGDDEGLLLTGKQRYEEYKAGQAELLYRQLIGELCRVAEVEGETANAVIELRRQLQGVGRVIRHQFSLAAEVEAAIDEVIEKKLAKFVRALDGEVDAGA